MATYPLKAKRLGKAYASARCKSQWKTSVLTFFKQVPPLQPTDEELGKSALTSEIAIADLTGVNAERLPAR